MQLTPMLDESIITGSDILGATVVLWQTQIRNIEHEGTYDRGELAVSYSKPVEFEK